MQYMSLGPIPLALDDKDERPSPTSDIIEAEEEKERIRIGKLVGSLKQHTITLHQPSEKERTLPLILNQVNCSSEIDQLLQKNIGLVGARPKRSLSVSERVVESATTLWGYVMAMIWDIITVWVYPVLRRGFVIGLICHRIIAELILRVLEWRLRPDYAALKDISATAQQVDIRLQQFCYWPMQYLKLRKRKNDWESVTINHPDYIRFYNSLWLVANDVIIGIALGSYIIDNAQWVAYQIDIILNAYTVNGLHRMISWLMDWPAGLKLNNELAAFLGDLFLWVIDYWAGVFLHCILKSSKLY
jgi:phosphatidylinositol glycan class Q protein